MSQTDFHSVTQTNGNQSPAELVDMLILCVDCRQEFVWSSGEQQFFHDKNLQNPPKRCKPCKQLKNERINAIVAAQNSGVKQKVEVAVSCAGCGAQTTVPFYPSQGRPVFCRACFLKAKDEAEGRRQEQ